MGELVTIHLNIKFLKNTFITRLVVEFTGSGEILDMSTAS